MGPPSDVSDTTLAALGDSGAQEAHVRPCLENGGGGSLQSGRYLVYKLPDGSPSVAKECVICMEDFVVGATIVRLPCSVLLPPGLYRQLVQERPGLSSACADFVILVRSKGSSISFGLLAAFAVPGHGAPSTSMDDAGLRFGSRSSAVVVSTSSNKQTN
ncbi:unnamed protein product [Tilletia laevis]|uniref:Uncharacterized protein n=1 Tax=Tilletia laevis TaxID=157183 RepID=A0A9N8M7V9_9BASI|nr:unnamed protein product [Tilletia laevis]CAD6971863.1 unnamed protein product [Tilletia controversa]CAD7062310.1 unnamed protein product [Tilletia caries]